MKTLRFFAVMLCIATMGMMTSCTKDDSEKSYEELIVGKWEQTNPSRYEYCTWEFTKDGYFFKNYKYNGEQRSQEAKYSIDGDTILFYWQDENGGYSEDYNDWWIFTITKLIENHMTIREVAEIEGEDEVLNFERI